MALSSLLSLAAQKSTQSLITQLIGSVDDQQSLLTRIEPLLVLHAIV